MNIKRRYLAYFLIAFIDAILILCSYFLASYIYLGDPLVPNQLINIRVVSWRDSGMLFLIFYSILLVLGYTAAKVYGCIYFGQISKMVKRVFAVNLTGLFLFMASFYIINLDNASRVLVFLFFVFSNVFVCFANWIAIHVFRLRRNSQKYRRNVLVVGDGHLAKEYAEAVGTLSTRLEHVIGYIDPAIESFSQQSNNGMSGSFHDSDMHEWDGYLYPNEPAYADVEKLSEQTITKNYLGGCLGTVSDIDKICKENEIDEIVLALDVEDYSCVKEIMVAADKYGLGMTLIPFYNDIIPRQPNIDSFHGVSVVDLRSMPLSNPISAVFKRFTDISLSAIIIILTSWLMAIIAIGVKISSPGPVLFKQLRIGKGNKQFQMLKFRSMRVNVESDTAWSTNEDPRKTRFGSFIRKYSIDELPQFFNVLKGDMSIVGPRPEIPHYVNQFREEIPLYMLRHQIRPGITGLAQISGLRGDTSIAERIELDLYYIQHWTYWLDVKIFFKTLFGGFINDEVIVKTRE